MEKQYNEQVEEHETLTALLVEGQQYDKDAPEVRERLKEIEMEFQATVAQAQLVENRIHKLEKELNVPLTTGGINFEAIPLKPIKLFGTDSDKSQTDEDNGVPIPQPNKEVPIEGAFAKELLDTFRTMTLHATELSTAAIKAADRAARAEATVAATNNQRNSGDSSRNGDHNKPTQIAKLVAKFTGTQDPYDHITKFNHVSRTFEPMSMLSD